MARHNFTVIKGGLETALDKDKEFVSAYVTDTRLMGVSGLYIHWRLKNHSSDGDFHQFFYFDAEEYGIETYKSVRGNDSTEIMVVETTLLGNLGGKKISLSEKEACFLLQEYIKVNIIKKQAFPEGKSEYDFVLQKDVTLTEEEKKAVFKKSCGLMFSAFQVINYFLMRCFGKDYDGAKYVSSAHLNVKVYEELPMATLCKNTIDSLPETGTYLCESLIEGQNCYYMAISEVCVRNHAVYKFSKRNVFKVTAAEAALQLARPEFITVYDISEEDENFFSSQIAEITSNSVVTVHENGMLFLVFNNDNSHVNKPIFRLNEDIYGMYYLTDFGQLISASYNIRGILSLEGKLKNSPLNPFLTLVSKYEFKEPVLYEFIQSEFEVFEDFLDFIRDE